MSNITDKIKEKLSNVEVVTESELLPRFGWDNPKYGSLELPAREVMAAYQNANKWLDAIKEHVLINLHCPYFSNIVHQLAHTMPKRFDEFGDILHKENLLIPYPATEEYHAVGGIPESIIAIYDILDSILAKLFKFRRAAEECGCPAMSIACDSLIVDIKDEYEFFYVVESQLESTHNLQQWDMYTYQYWENKSKLI